jgi:hypothetical protein
MLSSADRAHYGQDYITGVSVNDAVRAHEWISSPDTQMRHVLITGEIWSSSDLGLVWAGPRQWSERVIRRLSVREIVAAPTVQ